jgi:hypothetical protein
MRLHDLLGSDVLPEMAYSQKKAERILTALEKPINDHLLRLWTNPNALEREVWLSDLVNWIDEIAEIVLRPYNSRPPHVFYYKFLFFEPFGGGAEITNVMRRLRRLHLRGFSAQVDFTPDQLLARLRAFHRDLSTLCASKIMREEQIRKFVEDH